MGASEGDRGSPLTYQSRGDAVSQAIRRRAFRFLILIPSPPILPASVTMGADSTSLLPGCRISGAGTVPTIWALLGGFRCYRV